MITNKKIFSGGGTYISKAAIARLTLKKHIQMIIGGFFAAVFLFGIISGVTGYNEKLRENLITNIVMFVPSGTAFVKRYQKRQKGKSCISLQLNLYV